MDGRLVKAARAALGWSQNDLCKHSGMSGATVTDIENGTGDPRRSSVDAVEAAFRKAGVVFTDDGTRVGLTIERDVGD